MADVRTALEDESARGVIAEFGDEALPESIAPEPAPEPTRRTRPVVASSWARIADRGREVAESTALVGAAGLQAIRQDLGDCRRCNLCTGRTNIVFGVGDPTADLVVVGEAPGFHEDRQGEPFVGQAGQMLDRMLLNVLGLERREVHILNVIKCRPPDNRNPLPDEVAACMPFLDRQLEALQPKVILVLGTVALRALLGDDLRITRARGLWHERRGIPVMPTFHPAYLLRNPAGKRDTFADLKAVGVRYQELGGKRSKPAPKF
ncbi:MAG: uracil-DNA glycosylase [Deltaproteobacteria bacterium]|nr:MAG: uracil-DNA glycosylase [Deltaproteobacteria bacterium]